MPKHQIYNVETEAFEWVNAPKHRPDKTKDFRREHARTKKGKYQARARHHYGSRCGSQHYAMIESDYWDGKWETVINRRYQDVSDWNETTTVSSPSKNKTAKSFGKILLETIRDKHYRSYFDVRSRKTGEFLYSTFGEMVDHYGDLVKLYSNDYLIGMAKTAKESGLSTYAGLHFYIWLYALQRYENQ